jgi:hypothetical protein
MNNPWLEVKKTGAVLCWRVIKAGTGTEAANKTSVAKTLLSGRNLRFHSQQPFSFS